MWLIRVALRRPISVMVLAGALFLGALFALRNAPADIFPNLGIPVIWVVQPYAGMAPSQMESQFVTYYEYHFLYIAGLDHIESQSIQGAAVLKLYFSKGTDIASSMAQVTAMTFRATSFMPPGTLPAFILRFDAGSLPAAQLVFSSDTVSESEIQDAALYRVRPLLGTLPGASAPPPFGGKVRTIVLDLDPDAMRSYGISPMDAVQAVLNSNLTLPSGNAQVGDISDIVHTNAMAEQVSQLSDVPLRLGAGPTVFLRDIGKVYDGADIVTQVALVNDRSTVYMPVVKRADASTLDVVNAVKAALPRMQAMLPPGIKLTLEFDQSVYVTRAISDLVLEGAIGAVLTGLMVLLFLADWRSALIVIITIPLSLMGAVIALRLTGETINIMTLGGLALAVGGSWWTKRRSRSRTFTPISSVARASLGRSPTAWEKWSSRGLSRWSASSRFSSPRFSWRESGARCFRRWRWRWRSLWSLSIWSRPLSCRCFRCGCWKPDTTAIRSNRAIRFLRGCGADMARWSSARLGCAGR